MPKKKESKPIGRPPGKTFWGEPTIKGDISAPKRFWDAWRGSTDFKLLVKECLDSYELSKKDERN